MNWLTVTCTILVILGSLPLWVSMYQFLIIGIHSRRNHYARTAACYPRVSILVPAWNEASVLTSTIKILMNMSYPKDKLRIYVIDDASTDETPQLMAEKTRQFPNNVFHLRRENGGQGKAHTLNHGIRLVLEEDWSEAFLIMDADVLFEQNALRKMTRHLSDPQVGAVTAYIKEGSRPGNLMTRFIDFEYITAQAASRRAQNVMSFMACLAGGAQLHTRKNLEAIGGAIDTSSLAEDTFTTFKTQLAGHQAIFDGNAIVWAEEPDNIDGLWKQRLRWARGNWQITKQYWHLWFNKTAHARLGGFAFGMIWFAILLMPVYMILAATGLVVLFFSDFAWSWMLFRMFWILNVIVYVFVTLFSLLIDPKSARQSWSAGVLFPGLISLTVIVLSYFPGALEAVLLRGQEYQDWREMGIGTRVAVLFIYSWLALSMVAALLAKCVEKTPLKKLAMPLLLLSGYGPLLCAITFNSYVAELRGKEMKWDKTEKSGKVEIQ
ncbi:glycosyltransferase [Marinicella sediminis]|uniref:Glycosyltransferase n=1 Tax=Marinicella sediminis TaxID=1792834 RepID=A0ABV7JFA0_9GAMM|nr:glycosyltransferase [Marinicella sediminis]